MRTRPHLAARHAVVTTACAVVMAVAGCGGAGDDGSPPNSEPASSTASSSGSDSENGAAADLDMYLERLEAIHPEPFHGIDRADFVAALDALKVKLPTLTPDQSVVEVSRLTAMLTLAGRDGHQWASPQPGHDAPKLPFRVYEFAEGPTITAAMAPYEDMVGTQITAVAGHPIADVMAAIEPLVPRDGPATVPNFRPAFFVRTDILSGLGLIGPGSIDVSVHGASGERTVSVAPVSATTYGGWAGDLGVIQLPDRADTLYLSDGSTPLWSQVLTESHSAYVRFTQVRSPSGDALTAAQAAASDPDAQRFILDLRQNPGGDNHNNPTIMNILASFRDAHPGAPIVVMTDRGTFSAAANLSTDIEQIFHPVYVGEAAGGGLNFWDDVTEVRLDDLPVPMQIAVSTRYWQESTPDDPRLTIEPTIAIPVTAADYFADRDPALEAAVAVAPA